MHNKPIHFFFLFFRFRCLFVVVYCYFWICPHRVLQEIPVSSDMPAQQQKPGSNMAEDSYSMYTDSMATADESSFMPFQDESCMSFRKAQDVKSSRRYGGEVSSSIVNSRQIGNVAPQPTLGTRK